MSALEYLALEMLYEMVEKENIDTINKNRKEFKDKLIKFIE